jgi:tetratricopeptide (TPR) repeat protein
LNQGSTQRVMEAIKKFREAIQADPAYAPAHAGVALGYSYLGDLGALSPGDAYPPARAEALKALSLDPTLAKAHAALGQCLLYYDWDVVGAESEYRRAAQLDPSDQIARGGMWVIPEIMGRHEEALAASEQALAVDPTSETMRTGLAYLLYLGHDYDRAILHIRDSLVTYPSSAILRSMLADCYERKGMYPQVVDEDSKAFELLGVPHGALARMRRAFRKSGMKGYWQEQVRFWLQSDARDRALNLASVYALVGDKNRALECLNRACREHCSLLIIRIRDPHLDSLRSDPRYHDLAHRLGIPP